jgi:methylmalonyl-CoA/ethylmalonyl-CoA epimerase
MRIVILAAVAAGFFSLSLADLPEPYKKVASINWVVQDIDNVVQGWQKLGFSIGQPVGQVDLPDVQFKGQPAQVAVRLAQGDLGGLTVVFIQPAGGENAYSEFLKRNGGGVFSLNHNFPSEEALEQEVSRLQDLGIKVLQRGRLDLPGRTLVYVYMDTREEGKYTLGLVYDSVPDQTAGRAAGLKLSQFAFVVNDLKPVSAFWKRLGKPEMDVTHPTLTEPEYRGKPSSFDQYLGWQRHGQIVYEWIQSIKGPNVYDDFLKSRGEGVHHLAFDVPDMDAAVEQWTSLGFPSVQAGGWGEKGKPGSGRFAYLDTEPIGGIYVEFLWNHRGN